MAIAESSHSVLVIIIPAYKPDENFVDFISSLAKLGEKIVIVDDGSGKDYRDAFDRVEGKENVNILRHAVNLGKGRSLKNAFNYVLNQYPEALGVITADADGQHLIHDISLIVDTLRKEPNHLVLGCRNFRSKGIPWKSRWGNNLTKRICAFLCGVNVSDTQTGLRGIPLEFIKILLHTPGERYEYETNMLLECNHSIPIKEIPITTVYDSRENHRTHFDPLRDSFIIYKAILAYSVSSILATVIDFLLFAILDRYGYGIWFSTSVARISAAFANFLMNKNVVFRSKENGVRQFLRYALLVIVSGGLSAFAISLLKNVISINTVIIKGVVETCLFFFNYYVQRSFIFVKRKGDEIERSLFSEEITEKTDWTRYYGKKKSWISSFTQRYTLKKILYVINKWVKADSGIRICEMGGGNSCFAAKVCKKKEIHTYDVVDNNKLAVKLFNELKMAAKEHHGNCRDLLVDNAETPEIPHYDFVYSVGVIEHFRNEDVKTILDRHFAYCKMGGIVFITFPTPTRKYVFVRKCMELLGIWQFHDEKPIRYQEISDYLEIHGEVLEYFIESRLPLTQEMVVIRKGENM